MDSGVTNAVSYTHLDVYKRQGEIVPTATLPNLGKEALSRLKVKIELTKAELAYREWRSTQVPTGRMIAVKGRVSRKIGYKGAYIAYERVS